MRGCFATSPATCGRVAGQWDVVTLPLRRFNVTMRVIEHGSFTLDNYVKYYCTRTFPNASPLFYLQYDHDHNVLVSKRLRGGIEGGVGGAWGRCAMHRDWV